MRSLCHSEFFVPRPLRIAYARLSQETNALSPVETTLDDFRRAHFLEGKTLAAACGRLGYEAKGFKRNAELSGFIKATRGSKIETIPLFSAWAIPGGPLNDDDFAQLLARLRRELLAAGPLDGVFISLHGALNSCSDPDADATVLETVRKTLGPQVPIAATLDLHAQITPAKMATGAFLVGYQTNPHRDHAEVGERAGHILIRAIKGKIRPLVRWRSLPMLLGGGTTIDFIPPMRAIFRHLKVLERKRKVLSASVFMCNLWNRAVQIGWAVMVITDDDEELADTLVDALAEKVWAVRHQQPPAFYAPNDAIEATRMARLARKLGTVCFCDTSDVVGAGATGENTHLLRALVTHGAGLLAYVPLRDSESVHQGWGRDGETIVFRLGGKLDPITNPPLDIAAEVIHCVESMTFGRVLVLKIGDVRVVVTERAPLAMKPAFYSDVGLNPWKADIVVVKSFFPFRLFFLPQLRKAFYVKTKGITDLDAAYGLDFDEPIHPRDPVDDWRPTDARRRSARQA